MKKHPIQEPKAKPVEVDVRADLLAHGSPTREHIDPATGRVPEGLYAGDGHDRMQADVIARANHNDGDEKSSTPIK
jgi:hypothetical protein